MSNIVTKINSELKEAYKSRIAAANQAQSLKIISSDIYTEAERFIFELIQNAVDSYVDTAEESLDIRMELRDGYLVFMHNGKAFSDRDVEGICGIGNGSKGNDSKKIGYKGIGFDVIGLDPIADENLTRHKKLFKECEIVNIENLKNLDQCGDELFWFSCYPLSLKDCDGSPIRAIAWFE